MNRAQGLSRRIQVMSTAVAVVVAVAIVVLVDRSGGGTESRADPVAGAASVLRPDSHRLPSAPDARVTLVEFLDFECEPCAAMFPVVEQLRRDYGNRVGFVVRYFPIPSHVNAERAARAVEAAARQGKFEQMYQRMYQTQSAWADQRVPLDQVFRGFAVELGLDMAGFDLAYDDPATRERVRADFSEGQALGVQDSPAFFVNDRRINPGSYQELAAALDAALR